MSDLPPLGGRSSLRWHFAARHPDRACAADRQYNRAPKEPLMRLHRPLRAVVLLAALLAPALAAQTGPERTGLHDAQGSPEPARYMLPPKNVVDVFDAQPLPQAMVSPNHQVLALTSARQHPSIAELAQPMLRLAGTRVNPKTNGPRVGGNIYAITLK